MYLTEYREFSLKDVITKLEPPCLKSHRLRGKRFELLVSIGLFNESLMNDVVYKFKRYAYCYEYAAGIRRRPENEDIGYLYSIS